MFLEGTIVPGELISKKSLKNYFSRRLCWTFMVFLFLGLLSSWCYRSLWCRHWIAVFVNVPVDISGSKFRINTDPIHIYLTNLSWFFRLCHSKYNYCIFSSRKDNLDQIFFFTLLNYLKWFNLIKLKTNIWYEPYLTHHSVRIRKSKLENRPQNRLVLIAC